MSDTVLSTLNDCMATLTRREAERDFLLARHPGGFSDSEWVGLSSECMVAAAIRGEGAGTCKWWPSDPSDLRRCEVTYLRAPEHLKGNMAKILLAFRPHVEARYPGSVRQVQDSLKGQHLDR